MSFVEYLFWPKTFHLLPLESHQYLGEKGENEELFGPTASVLKLAEEDSEPGVSTPAHHALPPSCLTCLSRTCVRKQVSAQDFLHILFIQKMTNVGWFL